MMSFSLRDGTLRVLRLSIAAAACLASPLAPRALQAQTPSPASASPSPARPALTPHQRAARAIYAELVGINTVDSVGSTTRAARAMARRFLAAGFPAADVRVLVPPGKPTKGNLVVRYRGASGAGGLKPILLLAHLDVVAARRSDWPRDPFTLHEENGYFLGRGAADDKAMAAIFVANMLRYKKEGWRPERDLILALTADEEGGDANGVEWLLATHRALLDAAYAINEGGGGTLAGEGAEARPLFQAIQAAEKVPEDYTLTATNIGGHSSVPRPDNAINELAAGLVRVAQFRFPVALNPTTRAFFEQTAKVEKPDMAAAMRAVVTNPDDSAAAAIVSRDPRYNSMLRTTCVATRLAGGHAYNALPQTASANVNCRIVPTSSADEVRATLVRVLADSGISITYVDSVRERFPTSPPDIDPAVLDATTALTRRMWGDIPVVPIMVTGATDGRFLRASGVPTYGVSGIFSVPSETNAHGRDEKLRVKSFYDGLEFLDQLVRRLAAAPHVSAVQYRSHAGVEFRAQDDSGAVARAERALAADPRNVDTLIALGLAQAGARQYHDAIRTFSRGMRIAPANPLLYRWRGHRYISTGDYVRALADLRRGNTLDSTNYDIWYHLGVAHFIRGEFVASARDFSQAQRLAPNANELAGSTDWLWMALSRAGRATEARAALAPITDTLPITTATAYARRLKLYRGLIGPDDVLTPGDTDDVQIATLSYGVGNWYLVRGDTANARVWFRRAIESKGWPAFGFLAAEAELRRLP